MLSPNSGHRLTLFECSDVTQAGWWGPQNLLKSIEINHRRAHHTHLPDRENNMIRKVVFPEWGFIYFLRMCWPLLLPKIICGDEGTVCMLSPGRKTKRNQHNQTWSVPHIQFSKAMNTLSIHTHTCQNTKNHMEK